MKFSNVTITSLVTTTSVLLSSTFTIVTSQQPASKFAASWNSMDEMKLVNIPESSTNNTSGITGELLARIKPPGGKSLLVGVSGSVNIVTFTKVEGRNKGGKVEGTSAAELSLTVKYAPAFLNIDVCTGGDDMTAAPGRVVFASRKQTLSVDIDLDVYCPDDTIEECVLTAEDLGINGTVAIELGIETAAAHHFNFIIPNLAPNEYDVVACFEGSGETVLTNNDGGGSTAKSMLAINSRMITIEQVRPAKINGTIDLSKSSI